MGLPTVEQVRDMMSHAKTSSPSIAYFMLRDNMSYEDAMLYVRNCKPEPLGEITSDTVPDPDERELIRVMLQYKLTHEEAELLSEAQHPPAQHQPPQQPEKEPDTVTTRYVQRELKKLKVLVAKAFEGLSYHDGTCRRSVEEPNVYLLLQE